MAESEFEALEKELAARQAETLRDLRPNMAMRSSRR